MKPPRIKRARQPTQLFFVIPSILILLAVIAFPLAFNIYLSFNEWQIRFRGATSEFRGGDFYIKALSDPRFHNSIGKTFYLLLAAIPAELLLGLILALLLWEPFRGRQLISAFVLFPLALSDAVVGLIWGLTLVPTYGPFDFFMRQMGLWQLLGYSKPVSLTVTFPMEVIIIADVWQWTPFFFLVILAGFASIPKELTEAAEVDGASKLQMTRHVLLPMLKTIIGVALVIRIMDIFKSFGVPYVLTKGGPGFASEVVSLYIFNQALMFLNVSYAAALTILIIFFITAVLMGFLRGYGLRF